MLSDADKQRIEEEERYRAKVRAGQTTKPKEGKPFGCMACFAILAILFVLFVIVSNIGSHEGTQTAGREAVISNDGMSCFQSRDDALLFYSAARQNDIRGAFAVSGRGFPLSKGDRVNILMRDDGVDVGLMESGAQIGKKCYLLPGETN